MQCLTLALETPPSPGEYRVVNQFEEVYELADLARRVAEVAREFGFAPRIVNLQNPRKELQSHHYEPDHNRLADLGYQPTQSVEDEVRVMLKDLMRYRDRIDAKRDVIVPDIHWDGTRDKVKATAATFSATQAE